MNRKTQSNEFLTINKDKNKILVLYCYLFFFKPNSIWTKFQPFSCARDLSLGNYAFGVSSLMGFITKYLFIYLSLFYFIFKILLFVFKTVFEVKKVQFFSCLRDFIPTECHWTLIFGAMACMRAMIFCRKNFKSIQRAPRESWNSDEKRTPIFWSHYRKWNGAGANTRWFASIASTWSWAIFQKAQICNFPL